MYQDLRYLNPQEKSIKTGKFAVMDLGSNSLRLGIFDDVEQYPHPYMVERYRAKLAQGKKLGEDFILSEEKILETLDALKWFDWICKQQNVKNAVVVATSAIREAKNGEELVKRAKEEIGVKINVIDGATEAYFSAIGASKSIRKAKGLVLDLGGGSLEVYDTVSGKQLSLPLGILTLKEITNDNPRKATEIFKNEILKHEWIVNSKSPDIIANGGGMRAVASLHMDQIKYPIKVPQGYVMDSKTAVEFAEELFFIDNFEDFFTGYDAKFKTILPYRAALIHALFEINPNFKNLKFSNFGLREGVLFSQLEDQKYNLLEMYCKSVASKSGFGLDYAVESYNFIKDVLPELNQEVLYLTSLVKDMSWRIHKQYRASTLFEQLLTLDFVGVGHYLRSMIALSGYFTQESEFKTRPLDVSYSILSNKDVLACRIIGEIYKLTALLNPARNGDFSKYKLSRTQNGLELDISPEIEEIIHLGLQKRLFHLNEFIKEFKELS